MNNRELTDKVALVLGSIKGIGKAVGLDLAKAGAKVDYTWHDWPESLPAMQTDFAGTGTDHLIESIDLLDLAFRLEREFKIKIPRGQIEKDARAGLSAEEFENRGQVTEQGLAALREYLAEVPEERFSPKLRVAEIPTLFTVETFCRVVARALDRKDAASE